ncbi:hypothetical protein [Inquilinus limosus]|uniref:hypothetical protein n=1 Tax=Inquilinus limosus TaxID=171674 RepID=UPI001269AA7C|nr:hypothetical protein [Inquilinus limosus]
MKTTTATAHDDGPARALLDRAEAYPGLVEHRNARQLLRLWRYPSFEPWCSWTVIEARSGLFLRRVIWDQHDRSGMPQPVTYGCEAPLPPEVIGPVLGDLAAIRLVPFPTASASGSTAPSAASSGTSASGLPGSPGGTSIPRTGLLCANGMGGRPPGSRRCCRPAPSPGDARSLRKPLTPTSPRAAASRWAVIQLAAACAAGLDCFAALAMTVLG